MITGKYALEDGPKPKYKKTLGSSINYLNFTQKEVSFIK